jgi:hypothetical protein
MLRGTGCGEWEDMCTFEGSGSAATRGKECACCCRRRMWYLIGAAFRLIISSSSSSSSRPALAQQQLAECEEGAHNGKRLELIPLFWNLLRRGSSPNSRKGGIFLLLLKSPQVPSLLQFRNCFHCKGTRRTASGLTSLCHATDDDHGGDSNNYECRMQHFRSHLPSLPLPYPCVLMMHFTYIDNIRFIFSTGRRPYIPTVMRATVSPHDATAKNDATEDSRFYKLLHMGLEIVSFPFITTGELKWATGIMSVNDDFETCASTTFLCLHTL